MKTEIDIRLLANAAADLRGLTAYRIALDLGLNEWTVRRWLSGKGRIGDDKLNKILPYLGLDIRPSHP